MTEQPPPDRVSPDEVSSDPPRKRSAARRLREGVIRVVFLAAVVGCAVWSLDGRWGEVADAWRRVSPAGFVAAVALTAVGLWGTGIVWRRLVAAFDHDLPPRDARSVFFVSQLGKYVPGAVWAIGVQARLSARYRVPVRVSVTVALLFTGVHLLTAGLVAGVVAALSGVQVPGPTWVWALAAVACGLGLLPPITTRIASRAAGAPMAASLADSAAVTAVMCGVWTTYAGALLLLTPDPAAELWPALAVAFAAGYIAGVLVVFAPAGLGAREGVFVLVLSPVTGLPVATALALLARLVHTAADFALAGAAWWWARRDLTAVTARVSAAKLSVPAGNVTAHDDDRL